MNGQATAYVVVDLPDKQIYFIPRMDQWLTIKRVKSKRFEGTEVELRAARQSEMRTVVGKKKIKIPLVQTYRCVVTEFGEGTAILETGYNISTQSCW